MPVVMLIAVAVVLVGVFFIATGRGGELAYSRADHAPLDMGPVSAADIAMLRPPTALWGYNMQVTDEALDAIGRAMRDRDVTIAYLQQQLVNLDPNYTRDFREFAKPSGSAVAVDPDATQVFRATPAPQTPFVHKASPASSGSDADTTTFRAASAETDEQRAAGQCQAQPSAADSWWAWDKPADRGAPSAPATAPGQSAPITAPGQSAPAPAAPTSAETGPNPVLPVAATRPQPIVSPPSDPQTGPPVVRPSAGQPAPPQPAPPQPAQPQPAQPQPAQPQPAQPQPAPTTQSPPATESTAAEPEPPATQPAGPEAAGQPVRADDTPPAPDRPKDGGFGESEEQAW